MVKSALFLLISVCLFVSCESTKFRKADRKTVQKLLATPPSNDQIAMGTSFVFAFLNSHLSPTDTSFTEKLSVVITNPSQTAAAITISSQYPNFQNITANVAASSSNVFDINPVDIQVNYMEQQLGKAFRETKSIWISSTQSVKVVATNRLSDGSSEDSYAIFPICQLGTTYQAVVDESADSSSLQATNVVTIIATQDNTFVSVYPVFSGGTTLNAGQQLSLAMTFPASANIINASAPVAAFSGAVCGFGYGQGRLFCSHEALMLYPMSDYGTKYPVFKYLPEDFGDIMFMFSQENTTITEDGYVWPKAYGPNSYFVGPVSDGTYLTADKPFYVVQIGNSNLQDQGAPFLVHVVPPNLFTSGPVTFAVALNDNDSSMKHYVRIVTDLSSIGTVMVDSYAPNGLLYRRMGMSTYYFVDVLVQRGQHTVSSSSASKFSVTVYGFGFLSSYGFNPGLDLPANGVC